MTFTYEDFNIHDPDQDDHVVISATIINWRVHKILIDQGSDRHPLLVYVSKTQHNPKNGEVVP